MIAAMHIAQFLAEWDAIIAALPNPHLLQTAEWAQVKAILGWKPFYLVWSEENGKPVIHTNQIPKGARFLAAALILQRSLTLGGIGTGLSVLYAPKGPLLNWEDSNLRERVIADIEAFARKQRAIFIKIDPDVCLGTGDPSNTDSTLNPDGVIVEKSLQSTGWRSSKDQIQFRNTVLIDLTGSEDELLMRMKQKTRYNIRLASRKGIRVRTGTPADYPLLYRMYAETSLRDGFVIRDEKYYHQVWNAFTPPEQTIPAHPYTQSLIAEVDGEPVAGVFLFIFARKAWYLYGMSRDTHREKMPNYLLQWEAIRLARSHGCLVYDLWGAPEVFSDSDSMWGVYRFKEGLGGITTRYLGAWDYPVRPTLYTLYTTTLPRILAIMRHRGRAQVNSIAG